MVNVELVTTQVEIATQQAETASMYGAGQFDAIIGADPDPKWLLKSSYLKGYNDRFWEFYKEKYGIRVQPETTEAARKNYTDGYFDGVIGDKPQQKLLVISRAYRSGYQEGIIKFHLEEYQKNLTTKS